MAVLSCYSATPFFVLEEALELFVIADDAVRGLWTDGARSENATSPQGPGAGEPGPSPGAIPGASWSLSAAVALEFPNKDTQTSPGQGVPKGSQTTPKQAGGIPPESCRARLDLLQSPAPRQGPSPGRAGRLMLL